MKCVRCSSNKAKSKGGRCPTCLAELAKKRKSPGAPERGWKVASDASRRERGKTNKAKKKSSGTGDTTKLAKKVMAAEKKTGQKLSPDRKDNGRGYASDNVRMVPIPLNRGRHHVNQEKLNNWKSHLKKSLDAHNISIDDLESLLIAYTNEHPEYESLHKSLSSVFEPGFLKRLLSEEK